MEDEEVPKIMTESLKQCQGKVTAGRETFSNPKIFQKMKLSQMTESLEACSGKVDTGRTLLNEKQSSHVYPKGADNTTEEHNDNYHNAAEESEHTNTIACQTGASLRGEIGQYLDLNTRGYNTSSTKERQDNHNTTHGISSLHHPLQHKVNKIPQLTVTAPDDATRALDTFEKMPSIDETQKQDKKHDYMLMSACNDLELDAMVNKNKDYAQGTQITRKK